MKQRHSTQMYIDCLDNPLKWQDHTHIGSPDAADIMYSLSLAKELKLARFYVTPNH